MGWEAVSPAHQNQTLTVQKTKQAKPKNGNKEKNLNIVIFYENRGNLPQ